MTFDRPQGEDWRWSDLSAVPTAATAAPVGGAVDWRPWLVGDGPAWVLIDGRVVERPDGAGDFYRRAVQPLAEDAAGQGLVLELDASGPCPARVQVIHVATGGPAHIAHRYALAADAQADVLETYVSLGAAPAWANLAVEVELGAGARLQRAVRRLEGANVTGTETARVQVGEAAQYHATTLLAGAGSARAEHQLTLGGEQAAARVDGTVLAAGSAKLDVFNRLVHAVPRTTGRQNWRLVAKDRALAAMIGRIEVARGAQKADAEQSLKGLLLDRTAAVNAKPELEIFADDVKAAHGCAIGQLDQAALFYMAARGIAPARARVLLTEAFACGPLATAEDAVAREALLDSATRWLEGAL